MDVILIDFGLAIDVSVDSDDSLMSLIWEKTPDNSFMKRLNQLSYQVWNACLISSIDLKLTLFVPGGLLQTM